MNLLQALQQRVAAALGGMVDDPAEFAALVKSAQDARHGDYQANCAMPLAKKLGRPPRDVAAEIVQRLELGDMLLPPEIAGPGFINLRLNPTWLAGQLQTLGKDERLGVEPASPPKTIVIDYSSPNVAKPLHVGHLRSSIIGDALARLLRFLGHQVITDNHLGDWGTQFGILLYGYKHFLDRAAYESDPVAELTRVYVVVRQQSGGDEDEGVSNPVADACRQETAKLHAGDAENLALWREFMPHSMKEIEHIYERLGLLPFDYTHGESFYQPMFADVVRDLSAAGLAVESQGARVIFRREGEPPAIVQKSDGAFTYTTSDLATIRYRAQQWHPDVILYVVGAPQALHFRNLFEAARRWGYTNIDLQHIAFGSVLGSNRKLMSTRSGQNVTLEHLLDTAVNAAAVVYEAGVNEAIERGEDVPTLSDEEKCRIYQVVGIGAVKYADLSQNRTSDYVFDPAKMTATEGNTATYMQYAYARNRSIFRKGNVDVQALRDNPPLPALDTPHERALAVRLLRFSETLQAAAADYRPNLLTAYLFDLATTYSGFFQNCPVLKAETPELRQGRLLLCDLTARVIHKGLDLLGIGTIERM